MSPYYSIAIDVDNVTVNFDPSEPSISNGSKCRVLLLQYQVLGVTSVRSS